MDVNVVMDMLNKLGVDSPQQCIDSLDDGATSLIPTSSGATLALLRRGNTFDSLLVGAQNTGAVFPLRAVLEDAFLPMSESYANKVGVGLSQRDAIRKRIREAAVALDVIASGRLVSVPPPDFPVHPRIKEFVEQDGGTAVTSVDQLPESFLNDLPTLNHLQANVLSWSKEVERISSISIKGPGAVLTAEEEMVFWSSLDAALSTAESFIGSNVVKMSLDILARKRRAAGFLIETSLSLSNARRNSTAVLNLIQGLPLVALRSAESLPALKEAAVKVLEHIASKIRGSSFSVDRSLSLIHSMGDDVTRSMSRILSGQSNLLSIPYTEVTIIIEQCCELFEAWSRGFDRCRQVVREAARIRGEAVPPRSRTLISQLYSHLTEIYELRADLHCLRSVLSQLSKDPSHSSKRIDMLDAAFTSLLDTTRPIDHFKMTEKEGNAWLDAVNTYRTRVKKVEDMVCADFTDIVGRASDLKSLADTIEPFIIVVDKPFMSTCVEETVPYVLRLAAKELKMLQSRERLANSRDVKRIEDGTPMICIILIECLQICKRSSLIIQHIEEIVGKARMEAMPDLSDFVNVVRQLENRMQPVPRLSEWLRQIPVKAPKSVLFRVVEDVSSRDKRVIVNVDTQVAHFSQVYSMKVLFPKAIFSRDHADLARLSTKIHPVFSDLQQALRCYDMVSEHLKSLEESKRERLFPFVHTMLNEGQSILQRGFSLRWNSDFLNLSAFASDVIKHCSVMYSTYLLVVENDDGIQSALETIASLVPEFEGEHLSPDVLNTLKTDVFDHISGHRKALLEQFPGIKVDEYIRFNWHPKLCSALSRLLIQTTDVLFNSLISTKVSHLHTSISVQRKQDEIRLVCIPSIASTEQFLFNCLGEVYSLFRSTVETGYIDVGMSQEKANLEALNLLSDGTGTTEESSSSPNTNPFKRITRELERVATAVKQWSPFVEYIQINPEASVSNDGDDSAFAELSRLAEVYDSVISLQRSCESSKPDDAIISIDTAVLSRKIVSSLKDTIRDLIEKCGSESSALSQSLYKQISHAKEDLQKLSSKDILRVVVSLQGLNEDMLPSIRKTFKNLIAREEIFDRITNNVLRSSTQLMHCADSWVRCIDLKPHLESLEQVYEQRSTYSMRDKSALFAKHEELRKMYQSRMASIFSDFQSIRGKDCGGETYLDLEELIQDLEHQLAGLETQALNLERLAKALGVDSTVDRNGPRGILEELKKLRQSLERLGEVNKQVEALSTTVFAKADMSGIELTLKNFQKDIQEITMQSGSNKEANRLSARLSIFVQEMPLLKALQSVVLSPPRERDVLNQLFGDADHREGLHQIPLDVFWKADILSHETYLKNVFEVAAGEALISDFLRDVERKWSARKCQFMHRGDIPLLQGIPGILDELEEHMQALDTMKASSHAKLFESERAAWENRLALAHEKLELMADVQSRWAHLRTLFASRTSSSLSSPLGDLHEEISSFANVHARFSSVGMILTNSSGIIEGLEADLGLEDMQEELKGIVRGLARFLEKQRTQFPRFFFLSDDDLLHVLSVSSTNLEGLQPHVAKLFPGLSKLLFHSESESYEVVGVESIEGEVLSFTHPISISGKPIVSWLRDVQNGLQYLLKQSLKSSLSEISKLYGDPSKVGDRSFVHFRNTPVQTIILALRICFTEEVDICLHNTSSTALELQVAHDCIERNLSAVCSVRECPTEMGMSGRVFQLLRDQLIKEFVYQRDLVIRLQSEDFNQGGGHVWHNELRFYMKSNGTRSTDLSVNITCSCASFQYGWEYLGVGDALVRTGLTSRCYLILSEAMRRGFGGSPFGPAGTGKTETVKALGKALGRFVSVFNCDESFDSVSVGRILAGACRIGCWVCFDEFNRLSSSSLSSTSGQLASLQDAIKKNESEIANFYGGDLRVKVTQGFAIFVTMNPTYTGRRELPANLKSLFRPCAMSKPDTQPIAEVLLLSENFKYSTTLSRKLITLFSALRTTLSQQPHYDFGLRSLKSTIIACGSILSTMPSEGDTDSLGREEEVVIRGIGEVLKPKLDPDDVPDYERLVIATFSEASSTKSALPSDLERAIDQVINDRKLVRDNVFLEKIRQLYSLLQHHCGVMMVGPTGTGKSTVWRVLYESMKLVASKRQDSVSRSGKGTRSSLSVIDAKLFSTKQLYGSLDTLTREWTDGLFTKVLRSIAEDRSASAEHVSPLHWIVFDGDVDPDWIETLNSVLDDNRILTLPSGEQIPFLANTRILFETDHLRHANPSSVSRCGMVCFGNDSFMLQSFIAKIEETLKSAVLSCNIPKYMDELIIIIYKHAHNAVNERKGLVMEVSLPSLLHSFATLLRNTLESLFSGSNINRFDPELSSKPSFTRTNATDDIVLKTMLMCAVKAIGSGLTNSGRNELSRKVVDQARKISDVDIALQGVVCPCLGDVTMLSDGEFLEYTELLGQEDEDRLQRNVASPDVVIPTPTTLRLEHLLRDVLNLSSKTVSHSRPLILCGPPGCGKSMILMSALRDTPNVSLATLSFSSETTPTNILTCLKGHTVISKRPNGSHVLQPKSTGCRVILFCDEVNLEKPDRYETQTSVALLRSLTQHGGFWTGSPPHWVSIEGIQIVAACNPSDDAGRHRLAPRFLRHSFVIRVEEPTSQDLKIIYGTFNGALLRRLNPGLVSNKERLTSAMVELFARNKEKFSPSNSGPLEAHYIYSPRDLSRWIRGMSMLLSDLELDTAINDVSGHDKEAMWVDVIRAFCYEARRLFRDRLVRDEDREFVEMQLLDIVRTFMNTNLQAVPEFLYTSWMDVDESSDSQERKFQVIQFSQDFRCMIYEKLRVFSEEQGLGGTWIGGSGEGQAEDSNTVDQFAVTDDVLTHLTRIERILCQPLGHAVLMGAPGTGKKTLARFAAWMLSIEVHQVRSHSTYTEQEFAKDLRDILRRASVNNRQMLMIFDESHAMETAFLEMMNSLLACGEVPGLFTGDERTRLLEDLRLVSSQSSSTEQALYSEFVHRIRHNLHIIFTISLVSPHDQGKTSKRSSTLSDLSRRSPALYNRCTVDWIGDWRCETLAAVAELKLDVLSRDDNELEKICQCAVQIHEVADNFIGRSQIVAAVTPRHYLEFIEQFNRIVLEKGGAIENGVDRYKQGVERLRAAGEAVEDLKEELGAKAENLRIKEHNANEMLQQMVEEQRCAEKSKVEAEQLASAAEKASEDAKLREDEVALQLSEVLPKIEAAREAVGMIRKENLEELRAMPNPPEPVRLALEAVVMMLDGATNRSNSQMPWGTIRGRMRGSEFISSVVSFDGASLSKGMRAKITNRIIKNPSFDVNKISYASRAAGPLAEWTLAVLDYLDVHDSVEPLQAEVEELQAQQAEYVERQEAALAEAYGFKQRIEECRAEYARLVSEAERIRQDISESEANLLKAEKMLDSLGEEWSRWIRDMKILNASADTVWGDSVFAAAFIAYAGPLDYVNRMKLSSAWRTIIARNEIPFDQELSISEYLTTPEQRGNWSTNGLPTDASSLENYAILRRSARFPIIVDPTRGCSELLMHVLKVPGNSNETSSKSSDELRMAVSSFSATGKKSYLRALESAVRFGTVIILEDAERYDRVVTPLLGQEVFYGDNEKQNSIGSERGQTGRRGTEKFTKNVCQRVIRLGDRDVFLNSNFRMFLAAADLERIPRAAITRANVVSFELSAAALGSTCVSRSLKILAPEVERRRAESLSARVEFENRKRVLEEKVLLTVNNVDDLGANLLSGPLLEDLASLKEEVHVIDQRQKEEEFAAREIKQKERHFEPLGRTAVDIFSVIQSLVLVNSIYRFNTEFFLNLFDSAIHQCVSSNENSNIDSRDVSAEVSLTMCQRSLLQHTLAHIVASLFPRDRLAFAAALVLVSFREGLSSDKELEETNRIQMIRTACSKSVSRLECLMKGQEVQSVEESVLGLPEEVRAKFDDDSYEKNEISTTNDSDKVWNSSTKVLQHSLKSPEHLSSAVENLACVIPECRNILQGTNSGPEDTLRGALNTFFRTRKNPVTGDRVRFRPLLLCVRGDACDPAALAMEFANDAKTAVMPLAMGASVGDEMVSNTISVASRKCEEGRRVVVLVKNMHLGSKRALNRIHVEVSRGKGSLPCLLIVVVEISSEFSKSVVLSLSSFFHVLAFESPPSFRTNFGLANDKVKAVRAKQLNSAAVRHNNIGDNDAMQRMAILTSWLHASILERSLHCPVGFTKEYDFSDADLSAAWDILYGLLCSYPSSSSQIHRNQIKHQSNDNSSVNVGINDVAAVAHMLANCVYGCRVENDHDQEIVSALVNGLFSRDTVGIDLNNPNIPIARNGDGTTVSVPVATEQLEDFIRGMPVHAAAEWCHMPADTAVVAQTKDGMEVLRKVLLLSNTKFSSRASKQNEDLSALSMMTTSDNDTCVVSSVHDDNIHENDDETMMIVNHITKLCYAIPDLDAKSNLEEKKNECENSSQLSRFIVRERHELQKIVQKLKSDLSSFSSSSPPSATFTACTRISTEIRVLHEELIEITRCGSRDVPKSWHKISVLFGGDMNTVDMMTRVHESVNALMNLEPNRVIDLNGIIRPQALVTALRYEEAERRKVSPHQLYAVCTGVISSEMEMEKEDGVHILYGLRLNGAEWDEKERVFRVCGNSTSGCVASKFVISWRDTEDDEGTNICNSIGVDVYGRGRGCTPFWNVHLVVREGESIPKWRLSGAYECTAVMTQVLAIETEQKEARSLSTQLGENEHQVDLRTTGRTHASVWDERSNAFYENKRKRQRMKKEPFQSIQQC